MKKFKELFNRAKQMAPEPTIQAVIEAPKAVQQSTSTVTITKKTNKLNVLQPASPRVVAKMAKAFSLIPPKACDQCALGTNCAVFEEGAACGLDSAFKAFNTRDKEEIVSQIHKVVSDTGERYHRQIYFEQVMNGGAPMPETSRLAKDYLEQQSMLLAFDEQDATVSLTTEGDADDILAGFFGGGPSEPEVDLNPPQQLPNPVAVPVVLEEDQVDGSRVVYEH